MNSKIILPTAYFPSVEYVRVLRKNKKVFIDLGEHFVKQTIRNRCHILGPNKVQKLIVPLRKWANQTPVNEIRISYEENWRKLHWKSLESSYRSSPYFEFYESDLQALILGQEHDRLHELNKSIIDYFIRRLEIDCEIEYSLSYIEEAEIDMRKENMLKNNIDGFKEYMQVFQPEGNFVSNLSILDLICNEGPNAIHLLD